jgi:hypothetical protein
MVAMSDGWEAAHFGRVTKCLENKGLRLESVLLAVDTMLGRHRKLGRVFVGWCIASAVVFGLQACGGGPAESTLSDPSGNASGTATGTGTGTGTGTKTGSDDDSPSPKNEPPSDPSEKFKGPTRIQYSQASFGSLYCNSSTSSVDADLTAKTMTIKSCPTSGPKDAGAETRSVSLNDADVTALTSLVEALRVDSNADPKCSGFDGTSHRLVLKVGGRDLDVRHEFICSGPAPDVRIERPGFIALREKLHTLAGLDPKMPPY